VDKYQGQQNDYVLLSLVRSRVVGHLRDVRRLVVALSRARLGLYVFGRQELFANCFELAPAFSKLMERPTQVRWCDYAASLLLFIRCWSLNGC
jgi:intron-binding protein aquarius